MIDSSTRVFCIIGNPVRQSFSPAMHNAAFINKGINAVYTAFEVQDLAAAVKGIRALGIAGASVTIPYKVDIIPMIDRVTDIASMIGSVNTLIVKDGILTGDNTDAAGFYSAISSRTDIKGKRIALFGAGGAGRAILFSLFYYSEPAAVFLLDSDKKKGKDLRNNIHDSIGAASPIEPLEIKDWKSVRDSLDIIINATPVGMEPDAESSVIPEPEITESCVLMDIVYHPHETALIRSAKRRGCRVVYGADMLLYQGALQFELWTGQKASLEVMKKALEEKIYGK